MKSTKVKARRNAEEAPITYTCPVPALRFNFQLGQQRVCGGSAKERHGIMTFGLGRVKICACEFDNSQAMNYRYQLAATSGTW